MLQLQFWLEVVGGGGGGGQCVVLCQVIKLMEFLNRLLIRLRLIDKVISSSDPALRIRARSATVPLRPVQP